MPRMARLVVPGYPHHVTQRGSRKQTIFFGDTDYRAYIELICRLKEEAAVDIWAYCLMPNHVHLVAVPDNKQGLAKLFGVAHHRYARRINAQNDWCGHLWQERFHSFVMDESHLLAAVRYIELNPVRAGFCRHADQWKWSSVHAHLSRNSDKLVNATPMNALVSDWGHYLADELRADDIEILRRHTRTGRPAGSRDFIEKIEVLSGRHLQRRKPGPKAGLLR